jgi:acyl-CoA thioesterase I
VKKILITIILGTILFVSDYAGGSASGCADQKTYLKDIKILMQKKWPQNRTINIVCHGHSVPAGYFKTPIVDTFNSYPYLVHKELKKQYPYAVINVIVTAIGGENSERGAKRFAQDVLSHEPDVVLIDYGLNDRKIGLEKAWAGWESMIKEALAHKIKIILLTPTVDVSAKLDDPNDPLNQHAAQIRKLAAKYDVGLVDSLAQFKIYIKNGGKLEDLMSAGNHPNRNGHDLVSKTIMEWFGQ